MVIWDLRMVSCRVSPVSANEATTPVMAGFGIRQPAQVAELAPHVDGVIVGSALLDCIRAGDDPVAFLSSLSSANREVST